MSLIQTTTNELLPQIKIISLFLGQGNTDSDLVNTLRDTTNLYLEINTETINNITQLDEIIQDNEYYKYITITASIVSENQSLIDQLIESKNLLSTNGNVNLKNKFLLKNINSDTFFLKIEQKFDFDRFGSDNRINSEQLLLLKNTYGDSQSIVYPIISDGSLVRVFDNNEKSILIDKRFLDGLEVLKENLTIKKIERTNTSYFGQNFYQTSNNVNLTSFIMFDYRNFLLETSYFSDNALDNYSYTIEVLKNNTVIDFISVSNNDGSFAFTSKNSISVVHNYEKQLLVSVNETLDLSSKNATNTYSLVVTNKDQSFINFYNRITNTGDFVNLRNSYDQLKNIIYFATTRTDKNKEIYYLDPDTLKFQEDFILFYQQKVNYYDATFNSFKINVKIDEFLLSFFDSYNKFSKQPITAEQIQDAISLLVLENTTYDLWQRMFNTLDKFFNTLESYLYDLVVTPTVTRQKSFIRNIKKSKSFYSITNDSSYSLFPKIDFEQILNSFNQQDLLGIIYYFISNNVVYKNENNIQYDSETYNVINAYTNTKLKINNIQISNSNLLGFTNLEPFGVELVSEEETQNINNPIKFSTLLNPNDTNKNTKVSNNYIKLNKINNLSDNVKNVISNTNKMLFGISSGVISDTLSLSSLFPKIKFSKFNYEQNAWELIDNLSIINNGDLIKLDLVEEPEIFTINDLTVEQIDLANNYFIVDGVQ